MMLVLVYSCGLRDLFSYFLDNHKIRCKHCIWQTGGHFVSVQFVNENKKNKKQLLPLVESL